MRQQPGLDRLSIIRVAVGRDDRLEHQLSRYWTGKFIAEHLVRAERHYNRPLRLRRARFLLWAGAAVVGVARRVGHGYKRFVRLAMASAVFLPLGPYFERSVRLLWLPQSFYQ